MRSVTTKHNYQTALQHLILLSIKHPQTNPLPQLNQAPPRHQTFQNPWREIPAAPAQLFGARIDRNFIRHCAPASDIKNSIV